MMLGLINPAVIAAYEKAHQELLQELIRESQTQPGGQNDMAEPLLTAEQLAEQLNVPVSWVYEQSRVGKIPTRKIGRYSRFRLTEVLKSEKARERLN